MTQKQGDEELAWTPEQVAQIMRLARDDLTAHEISRRLGRTEEAVHVKAKQLGVGLSDGIRR